MKRGYKTAFITLSVLIALYLLAGGLLTLVLGDRDKADEEYITNTVGGNGAFNIAGWLNKIYHIELPQNIKIVHEADTGEGQGEAIYTVDKIGARLLTEKFEFLSIDTLISKYTSGNMSRYDSEIFFDRFGFRGLKDETLKPKNNPEIIYHGDYTGKTSYILLLDTSKQLLWLSISYPDHGGY